MERARNVLERLREQYAGQVDQQMEHMYNSIKRNLERAWEFYRGGNYRASLGLVNQVETAGQRLINALSEHSRSKANYKRRVDAVRNQLENLHDRLDDCGSETAEKLVRQAIEQMERAVELARRNSYQAALKALQQAKQMATRASRECGGTQSLQKQLERMINQGERLAESVSPSDETGRRFVRQARDQLRSAEDYLKAGRTDAATASMKAAQMALKQLKKHLSEDRF